MVRFSAIGIASTAAYVLLFILMQGWAGAQAANLIALLVSAVANTAANRRLTFGVRGSGGGVTPPLPGAGVLGPSLIYHSRLRRATLF